MQDAKCLIFNGQVNASQYRDEYVKAFECWYKAWEHAFNTELELNKNLHSDQFTRQDEVISIFHKNECVGVIFFNYLDLSLTAHQKDSYFDKWPSSAIDKLTKFGTNIIVYSNFTIGLNHRRVTFNGHKWKDILMGISAERLKDTDATAMTGTMRNSKSMQKTIYAIGAVPIVQNMEYSGPEDLVDLTAVYKNSVKQPLLISKQLYKDAEFCNGRIQKGKMFEPAI